MADRLKTAALLVACVTIGILCKDAIAQNYAAFTDESDIGFDGVAAHIEVMTRFEVSDGVSAWCGIDEGTRGIWLQVGWRFRVGYTYPQKYYEYVREDGYKSYPIEKGDAVTSDYEIERDGQYVRFYINNQLIDTLDWADFDLRLMCKAQYGAEVHADPYDHVPGTPGSTPPIGPPLPEHHCHFTDVENRRYYGTFQTAGLLGTQSPVASCYEVIKSGSKFEVWDKRPILGETCP